MSEQKLPKRLRYIRDRKGFSQKFVAEKLEIKSNTLSGYESGRRVPDPEMLSKIADIYEVTTDYLIGRSNQPKLMESGEIQKKSNIEEALKKIESLPIDKQNEIEDYIDFILSKNNH